MKIDVLLDRLASPAHRAILNASWTTLEEVAGKTQTEINALHGIGGNALQTIRIVLNENGLSFLDEVGQEPQP